MERLSAAQVGARLAGLRRWRLDGETLVADYRFQGFPAAVAFVNRVAGLAEAAGHHPDIDIRYDRVRLVLSTHDAGGLTDRDFALADRLDGAAPEGL